MRKTWIVTNHCEKVLLLDSIDQFLLTGGGLPGVLFYHGIFIYLFIFLFFYKVYF